MILQSTTTAQTSLASKKHHQHPPIVTSPVDSSADTINMPAIEEEEDIDDKAMMVIYDNEDAQLSSFPFCGANAVDALAFADTVEDILPNNHVTRYLKSKFETDSTRDDEENDESTLNTLNTTMNTTTTGLHSTSDRTKEEENDDDDDNRTVEMAYPDDEGIETCLFSEEGIDSVVDGNKETSEQQPEYPELLSDLHLDSSPSQPDGNNQKTSTTTTKGIDGDEQDPTMMETSMESGVMSLRFSPWLGGGEGHEEPPKESPKEPIANDSVPTIAKASSGDPPDDATAVSKATTFKGDDGRTICSLSTECGFEIVGKGFEQGAAVPLKKKRSLLERIGSNISHKSKDSISEATADASREHRLEEMKAILSATNVESTKKKKGKRRIWRIGKKKGKF